MTEGDVPATVAPIAASEPRPRSVGLLTRLRPHVRPEDLLLFAWLIIQPIVFPPSASGLATGRIDIVAGLLDVAALCGLAACLIGRTRTDVRPGLVSGGDFAFAVGPLFGAATFIIEDSVDRLGLGSGLETAPIFVAIALGLVVRFRLPPLSAQQRRILVMPFVLATSRFFGEFIGGISGLFDLRSLSDALSAPSTASTAAFVVAFIVLGVLVFYAMFVYAPSQIAEREGGFLSWTLRFAVFLLGLAIGATLRGL